MELWEITNAGRNGATQIVVVNRETREIWKSCEIERFEGSVQVVAGEVYVGDGVSAVASYAVPVAES